MTRPETEACIRAARTSVLAIWNRTTDPEIKVMADDAYRKLASVLREWGEGS